MSTIRLRAHRPAAGATGAPHHGGWLLTLRRLAVNGALVVSIALFGFLAVGPHLFGYRTEVVLTGSMAPTADPGDVLVVVREPTADVEPGQILSFHPPLADRRVVTHRVVGATHRRDGSLVLTTKGDANPTADPWRAVVSDEYVWRVRAVVPRLGDAVRVLRTDAIRWLLVWAVPGLVAGWLLYSVWRPERDNLQS
jgi:signal peptidase I